ncbi:MAG: histidine kinase [Chitinophagaceae bacterium]|nr:histidine kinase [Chitinophagaceae bacterium]
MLRKYWLRLVGDPDSIPMENRAVNSISIITLLLLFVLLPLNWYLGLTAVTWFLFVLIILQAFVYWLSRYRHKYYVSMITYAVASYATLIFTYIYNSGTNGPTLMLFFITLPLLIAFTRKALHIIWILAHILIAATLVLCEHLNPGFIVNIYPSQKTRLIDIVSSFSIVVIIIYFVTSYLRMHYMRQRNKALEQNMHLERLHQENAKLFSIIAHDLRSPLSSIKSYLEIMGQFNNEQDHRIRDALINLTGYTLDMLTNLLAWSKNQMEKVSVNLQPVMPSDAIRTTLDIQRGIATNKNIHIVITTAPLYIMADPDMLQIVLRNLLSNAIKFSVNGSEIYIHAGNDKEGSGFITVKDKGQGIPYEKQKDIFTMQSQPGYGTENEKGMGLGLLLCKEYTELQHGRISFLSVPGEGSDFTISFPLQSM